MQIDHINIRASKETIDRVKDFYCQVLDLEDGYRPNFSSYGFWLYANQKPVIHLSIGSESSEGTGTGSLDHVAFQVSDLAPIVSRLEEFGIEFKTMDVPDLSLKQLFFKDPAGVKIELNCFEK